MATGLLPSDIDDFVATTLPYFYKGKWTDISLEHPEYISPNIINEKNVKIRGGETIRFKLQTSNNGNARNTGLYDQDVTGVEDLMDTGTVPWTFQTGNWSYDVREPLFQSDEETIVDELAVREHACMNDIWSLHEENLWSEPTSASDKRPMGIPFWLQKNATTGFNGGNPSGFSGGCAGIDSTAQDQWRNYTFAYSAVTPDDLVAKVKSALRHTNFMPVHPHPELGFGRVQYHAYTTESVIADMERLAETRNDNLGADLARYMNQVVIGGVPFSLSWYLDSNDSSNPIYGVNWRFFRPFVKAGWNMKRHRPKVSPKQRNVREVHFDHAMNYVCTNRRGCWVGYVSS